MSFLIAAESATPTNVALTEAIRRRGVEAAIVGRGRLEGIAPGDTVLGRIDVLPSLDGVQACLWAFRGLEQTGVRVLNGTGALLACHDKLLTAIRLGRHGIPHPRTAHADSTAPALHVRFPVVVKPRLGSWGKDVVLCEDERALSAHLLRLRRKRWFRRQGALVQELVPPQGRDLRLVVAGGDVVGAVARIAPPGEWRTNVALGATRQPVACVPEPVRALAVAAAAAVGADLVAVDLLPDGDGHVVLELNGAADFTAEYSLQGRNVFDDVAQALLGGPRGMASSGPVDADPIGPLPLAAATL
jgi:[lysine-biosynthesis-protein LysW]--L-2-aminoadipate ligase